MIGEHLIRRCQAGRGYTQKGFRLCAYSRFPLYADFFPSVLVCQGIFTGDMVCTFNLYVRS